MIGQGKPNQMLYRRGDTFILEDTEQGTYTLYRTVETFGQLKPKTEKKIKDEPYYYDLEHEMYYQLTIVGQAPNNDLGMGSLLALLNPV